MKTCVEAEYIFPASGVIDKDKSSNHDDVLTIYEFEEIKITNEDNV